MTDSLRIIILDDEPKMGRILARILTREGYTVEAFDRAGDMLKALGENGADLLVTDLKMPDMDGLEVMARARDLNPNLDVIMMTAYATVETAVNAMKLGAFDYLIKPFPNEELIMLVARVAERRMLREENQILRAAVAEQFSADNIVAASPAMRDVLKRAAKVATSDVSVLLRGESGTGKEVLACAIHASSPRKDKPLVKVNCGALPETLLESELFGHTRGAFTGAVETRKGLFQQADGGTIFLDEIGEISPALQVKLLRVLQSGEFQRVGDAQTFHADVRVIAATNRDLEEMIETGQFRSDLYYRLNVVPITIPPLRERTEDIPALIDHFLGRARQKTRRQINISTEAFERMRVYRWPGNIRELENAVEHACVMCEGDEIHLGDLPLVIQNDQAALAVMESSASGRQTLEQIEKQALIEALESTGYNHTRAAELLGITRRTLGYRIDKYNLPRRNPGVQAGSGVDQ
ncbi:sigma-54 dependent transcriptional regulator [bacterium]|nr:sigma-54 dependent transcriptional regulator [bacterium]